MSTFDELALQGDYPVVHSKRSDQAALIATRVPLTDPILGRWGWVLTLNHKNGRTDSDDIATLRDNTGRQYPKVYLLADMQNYIETWGCTEWEEGYHQNGHQPVPPRNISASDADVVREDMLKQLISDLQERQEQEVTVLKDEIKEQLEAMHKEIVSGNAQSHQQLHDQTVDVYNRLLERFNLNTVALDQQVIAESTTVTKVVEEQSLLTREATGKQVGTLTQEIKNHVSLTQKNTLDAVEAQSNMSRADTVKLLEREHEEIRTGLAGFVAELKALEEQIKFALQELDPDIEEDLDKTQIADPASTATKMARKATTQIERITLSHQKMSTKYFDSANDQSKQGFKLAWTLIFTAVGLLVFTIAAAVFMAILQLYGFTIIIGSIGTLGTTIITVMGAISSFHAKTTEQFAYAQRLLDRRYGSTIANAMIIGYPDDDHKKVALDKIVDSLLKDEVKDVGVK